MAHGPAIGVRACGLPTLPCCVETRVKAFVSPVVQVGDVARLSVDLVLNRQPEKHR